MSFRPGSSSGNKKNGKRRTCPPQPAMFMLHSPVPIATSPLRAAEKDTSTKTAVASNEQDAVKETKVDSTATATATNNSSSSNTKDETVQDKKPAAVTTDMPSDAPIPSSNQDDTTAAHAAASDNDNDDDHDDDHDSITGEMNGTIKNNKASSSSPGDSTDKTSKKDSHQETTSLPNNSQLAEEAGIKIVAAANNSDSDNEEEDDDDDENPKSTNTSFPRTAIKRPRNSASAIAYAKKMREREEADTKKKEVELEGIKRRERVRRGAKAEKETEGEEGLEEKKGKDKGKSERRDESKGVPVGQDGGKEESVTKKSRNEKDSKSSTPSSPSAPASTTVDSSGKKRRPKRARMSSTPSSKPSQEANDDNDDGEKKTDGKGDKKDPENDVASTAPAASSTRSTSRRGSKRVAAAIAAAASASESTAKKSREKPKSAKKAKKSAKNKTEAHGDGNGDGHGHGNEESTKTPTTPSSSTRRSTRSRTSTVTSLPDKVASVELQRGRKRLPTRKVIEAMDYDALVASGSEDSVEVASKKTATKPKAKAKAAAAAAAKPDKVTSKSTIATPTTPVCRPGTEHTWKTRMVLLRAHHATYGTCDLNAGEEKPDHLLKNFVSEMRKQYRKFSKGESSQLTPAKVQELLDLEFDFFPNESGAARANTRKRNQKVWDEHFSNLEKYYKEHGDCLVPCVAGEYYVLANWVRGQRKLYKRLGREAFDQDHLRRLEALGFDFTPMQSGAYIKKKIEMLRPKVEATWNRWFSLLLKFKEDNGHLMVSPKDDGYPQLYDWIHCQRKDYKKFQAGEKSSMCDEWIKRMNAINFDWAPMQSEDYGALLKLRLANSERYIEAWNDSYQKLKKFHKKQGNCYVFRGVHDEQLANWIHCQRKLKKIYDSGKHCALTEERINLLNEIDFDWSPSQSGAIHKMRQAEFDKEWEATFKLLRAYKKKTGHCTPKKTYPKLGCWTQRMRKLYAQNQEGHTTTLTKEKIAKLESIDFEFVKE